MHHRLLIAVSILALAAVTLAEDGQPDAGHAAGHGHGHSSRLSDEVLPPQVDKIPERPRPLLELGEPFLDAGELDGGFELPTGATWRPNFLLFGTARSGFEAIHRGNTDIVEWANRLDLFGNLELSGTERLLVGIRPLDGDGRFTGVNFEPDGEFVDATNLRVTTLFFEGDFGEIFPDLDPSDRNLLDIGFSVGKQPHSFQDGMLLSDSMQSVMLTRNSVFVPKVNNIRMTGLFAWEDIHRGNNEEDNDALLFGFLTEVDTDKSTIELDAVTTFSDDGGDGLYFGLGATQRIGAVNTTFRVNTSIALDEPTPFVSSGTLLFAEASVVPHGTHDNLYLNAFVGIDRYSSAARGELAGGPLGRVGILFAATGLGTIGSPLSNSAERAFGGAVGYQKIFGEGRSQLIFEAGGRLDTDGSDAGSVAGGIRYQQALGQHTILFVDGFGGWHETDEELIGGRLEFQVKF